MGGDITRYVVTIKFQEETLTELNELNNHLTRAGFTLTLTDDDGKVHELGTNAFGLISPQNSEEIKALASGLADAAIGKPVEIDVITFEEWLKDQ